MLAALQENTKNLTFWYLVTHNAGFYGTHELT